ncbi:electron transfer flavoprotein subunit beta/FixA family protein [Halopenitus persicus]|uniref:electron transfer flavoprotein subunit beta/FixA family protein n=1 Tax=Halopenitus persicus TaxID=1048396 RepID=UPI000BBB12EF|nr:electron transfer flavoprotein subunit beta/FixA family protein [Halopenitus persicus]
MKALVAVKEVMLVEDEFEIEGVEIAEQHLSADLNEWDGYAIEEAVELQEDGIVDEVVTVTIGPEECEQTIRQALAKGADRSIRIWDDTLEGADLIDVDAKTEILSAVIEEENPDLVLTGVQAGDDSFAATGVSVAENLGFQWGAVVNHLEHDFEDGLASVHRELEGGIEELTDLELPAVLTIQTGINEPRYASLRGIRQAQRKELDVKTLSDIGVDESRIATEFELTDMYEPESKSDTTIWEGNAGETSSKLGELLRDKGVAQ